ncbi:MAG: aldehyde ferredoxin oxidoreductase family protein [Chloroflexi bacterium]|nr:aldehyde ferredoxin oxidoreductase family protein [Chloroflexota bacterium]
MAGGYTGKVLNVDLSNRRVQPEALDEKIYRGFLGGYGLGARVLFSRQRAGVDPLGPENILGFTTGLLAGTPALFGTRFCVVGKSPLTSAWGNAHSGGFFGSYLKFSGYDAVFVSGISDKPVYLFIDNGKAELRDASALWGKDTRETEGLITGELGRNVRMAMIGPSGEKVSLLASVISSDGRAAARCGMGAVMGAKKLKAIVARGKDSLPLADAEEVARLRKKHLAAVMESPMTKDFRNYGTTGYTQFYLENGEVEFKNWAGAWPKDMADVSPFYGEGTAQFNEKNYSCYRCPVGCGARLKAGAGEYKWEAGSRRAEYETLIQFGTLCLNDNAESVAKANDICNRYGIDTISAGGALAFAMECYQNGLITKEDTEGIELTWGNHRAMVAMLEKLVRREGFGAVLADGTRRAAERIGRGSERYAVHAGGQEMPAHDPKGEPAYTALYTADAAPGLHCGGSETYAAATGRFNGKFDAASYAGRGEAHSLGRNFVHVLNATGICLLYFTTWFTLKDVLDNVNAVTGWGIKDTDELLACGERIANIRQAFTAREGLTVADFHMPDRVIGRPPLKTGPTAGRTLDTELMVRDFLKAADWDPAGKPSRNKLLSLGLDDVAAALWPSD